MHGAAILRLWKGSSRRQIGNKTSIRSTMKLEVSFLAFPPVILNLRSRQLKTQMWVQGTEKGLLLVFKRYDILFYIRKGINWVLSSSNWGRVNDHICVYHDALGNGLLGGNISGLIFHFLQRRLLALQRSYS